MKILFTENRARQAIDIIQKVASDVVNNKVDMTKQHIETLINLLTYSGFHYIETDEIDNEIGDDGDFIINEDGVWIKYLGEWMKVVDFLSRITFHTLTDENTPLATLGNFKDLAISPEGVIYQKEENDVWRVVHTPIPFRVYSLADGSTLTGTFGNNNDIAIDELLRIYQKKNGMWMLIKTLNAYTKSEVDVFIQNLQNQIGDLNNLNTSDKTNLVNAINEVLNQLNNITDDQVTLGRDYLYLGVNQGDNQQDLNEAIELKIQDVENQVTGLIDDSLNNSTEHTWSITKIKDYVATELQTLKDEILGNVDPNYNTLEKIQTFLEDYETRISALETEIDRRVDVDEVQTFTEPEKQQARDNIGAASQAEVQSALDNSVRYNTDQSIDKTEAEKLTARTNIDVHDKEYVDDIKDDLGDKSFLTTTNKTNLVLAVNELQAEIIANTNNITQNTTDLGKRVAVDQSQSFTGAEQQQGRDNIDVYSTSEVDIAITNSFNILKAIIGDETQLTEPTVIDEILSIQTNLSNQITGLIDDALATSLVKTYSIDKIRELITDLETTIKGGVSASFDTLSKIETELGNLSTLINNINTTLTNSINNIATDLATTNNNIGDLNDLDTTDKSKVVNSINEVYDYSQNIIDDTAIAGTLDKTYSADKLLQLLQQLKDEILGGVGPSYDTLLELLNEIQDNDSDIAQILISQSKRVAVDITQAFTAAEMQTGRNNIDVYSRSEVLALTDTKPPVYDSKADALVALGTDAQFIYSAANLDGAIEGTVAWT